MPDMNSGDLGLRRRKAQAPVDTVHFAGVNRGIGDTLNTALVDLYKAWMKSRAPAKGKKAAEKIVANRTAFIATMLNVGFRIVPQSLIDIDGD